MAAFFGQVKEAALDRKKAIIDCIGRGDSGEQVAMRLMVLSPTFAFEGKEDIGFEITESVADFFNVSVRSVHVCGSAKLGFSPHKGTEFIIGSSDLDLAVIDENCFTRYVDEVISVTKQYRKRTGFQRGDNNSYNSFVAYLAKGIFRPDLMPYCDTRRKWLEFFGSMSIKYSQLFESISAAIYLSDQAFRMKQSTSITEFGTKGAHL